MNTIYLVWEEEQGGTMQHLIGIYTWKSAAEAKVERMLCLDKSLVYYHIDEVEIDLDLDAH